MCDKMKRAVYIISVVLLFLLVPSVSFAESYCPEEVKGRAAQCTKELVTKVSGEGFNIFLAVLDGLIIIMALVIVLPKAISYIRRFVKVP